MKIEQKFLNMDLKDIIYLKFISPQILQILKILSLILSSLFLLFIILLIRKTSWLRFRYLQDFREFFSARSYEEKKIAKSWVKILKRLERPLESEYKLAIIEADLLLAEILGKMGYLGETLGEKLERVTSDILPSLEEVKEAHQFRNNIVHDPDYKVTLEECERKIRIYEKALRDLNML